MTTKMMNYLKSNRDENYPKFVGSLNPDLDPEKIIGVRTPVLRSYAKEFANDPACAGFLQDLPHTYYEENQIHAFLLCNKKDFPDCIKNIEKFLPYVDNWATCDSLNPKAFAKNPGLLLPYIRKWLISDQPYTVRFAIGRLMAYYLDDLFDPEYPALVLQVKSDNYYVNMMRAWYFATALSKQYDAVLPYMEKHVLDDWPHRKAIQKACESYKVTEEHKQYLRSLR